MPQLEIHSFLSQIFWLFWAFILLYAFTAYYFIPNISIIIERRREKIAQDIADADVAFKQHSITKIEIEHRMNEVRMKALELRNNAALEAKRYIDKSFAKLEDDLVIKMKEEDSRLDLLKEEYRKGVGDAAKTLAKDILSIILNTFKQQIIIK